MQPLQLSLQLTLPVTPGVSVAYLQMQENLSNAMRRYIERSRGRLELTDFEKLQFANLNTLNLTGLELSLPLFLNILRACPHLQKIEIGKIYAAEAFYIYDMIEAAFHNILKFGKNADISEMLQKPLELCIDCVETGMIRFQIAEEFRLELEKYLGKPEPDAMELFHLFEFFFEAAPSSACCQMLLKTVAEKEHALPFSGDQLAKLIIILAKQTGGSIFTKEMSFDFVYRLYEMQEDGRKKIYAMNIGLLEQLFQTLFPICCSCESLFLRVSDVLQERRRAEFLSKQFPKVERARDEGFSFPQAAASQNKVRKLLGTDAPRIIVGGRSDITSLRLQEHKLDPIVQKELEEAGLV
jgi:hypothetical protein